MNISEYKEKNIIGWLYYNKDFNSEFGFNTVCYVYPRIICSENSKTEYINPEDFPTVGRIEVRLPTTTTAEEVFERFGNLVEIRINADPIPNPTANNHYRLRFTPTMSKMSSDIWIERLSSKLCFQIIEYNGSIEELRASHRMAIASNEVFFNEILVGIEDKLYGPFDCERKEQYILLSSKKENQYFIAEYSRPNFADDILDIEDNNNTIAVSIIHKSKIPVPNQNDVQIDWIDDQILIGSLSESLKASSKYSREQVRQIKTVIASIFELETSIPFTEERSNRIKSILKSSVKREDTLNQISHYILEEPELSEQLVDIIISDRFDIIEKRSKDFEAVKDRLNNLQEEEHRLRTILETMHTDIDAARLEVNKDNHAEVALYKNEIEELVTQRDSILDEIQTLKQKFDLGKELEALQNESNFLKEKIQEEREKWYQERKQVEAIQQSFRDAIEGVNEEVKVIAKGLDKRLLDRVLRMAEGSIDENGTSEPFDTSLLDTKIDGAAIINHVSDYLKNKANREITDNDVVNYLICINQGFITTFAGEPGTGKTSLCNILSKSLGLARSTCDNKRFVEVSVERGWTSHKDFIGYYNPLTKQLEKSNSEVFSALTLLNDEKDIAEVAPFIILLDEANLSPIEHYWAAFLRNCDYDSSISRTVSLGGNSLLVIPQHLRFLATVNFDHTTEALSPRFLDRSWIISLSPTQLNEDTLLSSQIDNSEEVISFNAMQSAFSVEAGIEIDDVILKKWNAIKRIFSENLMQIMPRNLKMVQGYCAVACRYMDTSAPEVRYAPIDYAVSQKILPTINGSGDRYKKLIDQLIDECGSMPISLSHLERIKRVAELNLGYYQFFAH